jgi:hypothetical protein
MKQMKYLAIIAAIILMASCENQESKQKTETEEVVVHEAQADVVILIDNEKWNANFATTKGIVNMKELMLEINNDSELSDYRELGTGLQKEFQNIFARCDMTGEAHNQLHNYLHPMLDWFTVFKEGDLDECKSATNAFSEHLEKYGSYFK